MSACAARRFGPGTPCSKPETPVSKDFEDRLKQLQKERETLDSLWAPAAPQNQAIVATQTIHPTQLTNTRTSIAVPTYPIGKTRGF